MNYQNILKKKIISKKSVICVIGLGYVGSELLKKFDYEGFKTIGIDINFVLELIIANSSERSIVPSFKTDKNLNVALFFLHSCCHGTKFEWCSITVMIISSPSVIISLNPDATKLTDSVVPLVNIISL